MRSILRDHDGLHPTQQLLCHEVVPRTAPSLTRDTGQTNLFTVPLLAYLKQGFQPNYRGRAAMLFFLDPANREFLHCLEPIRRRKPRANMNTMRQGHEHAGPRLYVPNQRAPDLVSCAHYAPRQYARLGGCMSRKNKIDLTRNIPNTWGPPKSVGPPRLFFCPISES